jgi:hypothetical protein
LVDSPRTYLRPGFTIPAASKQRDLDAMLHCIVRQITNFRAGLTPKGLLPDGEKVARRAPDEGGHELKNAPLRQSSRYRIRLAMFPTPQFDYFIRCAADSRCKPHLRAFAQAILGTGATRSLATIPRGGGQLFTRFMLGGFAAFRALERLAVESFESYPYVVFALWKNAGEGLSPKYPRLPALRARQAIIARLADEAEIAVPSPHTLDQADAAVLAITAHLATRAANGAFLLKSDMHGSFFLALRSSDLDALTSESSPRA